MATPTPSITINFNTTETPAFFELIDTTDYAGNSIAEEDVRGCFTNVEDPLGNVIAANTDFSDPDIQPDSSTTFDGIDIPTDTAGDIIEGEYSFTYGIVVDAPITAVSTGSKTFTIAGNYAALITSAGSITVVRSSGNNAVYTVVSAVYGSSTVITVSETINVATVDGSIQYSTQTITSVTQTVTYADVIATIAISQVYDCFCGTFTSTDSTSYGSTGTILSRTHTVKYPVALNKADVVSSNAIVSITPIYTKTWTTIVTTTVSYDLGGGNTIEATITGSRDIVVNCDISLCDISCGVTALNDRYNAAKTSNPILANQYLATLERVMQLVGIFQMQKECGLNTQASTTLSSIRTEGNFTEGCGCGTSDSPVQIVPLCGSGGTYVSVTQGIGITVTTTVNGNQITYNVKLSDAYVAIINAMAPTNVVAGAGVTVVKTTPGGVNTYTVTNTAPYVEENYNECRATIAYSNFAAPTVAIAVSSSLLTGSNMVLPTVESVGFSGDPNWANLNNLFKVSAFQTTPSNTYKVVADSVANGYIVVVGVGIVLSISAADMYLLGKQYDVEILNQISGEFYFRFVDSAGFPISNSKMTAFPSIIMNLKISE